MPSAASEHCARTGADRRQSFPSHSGVRASRGNEHIMSHEPWAWAHAVAEEELALSLPQRWAHSQGVARRASELASMVGSDAACSHRQLYCMTWDMHRG